MQVLIFCENSTIFNKCLETLDLRISKKQGPTSKEHMSNRRIKLIWDFRGPTAAKTAEHHEIHLTDYIIAEKLDLGITGCKTYSEMHSIAFLVVDESKMIQVRDALKPHRGEVYED